MVKYSIFKIPYIYYYQFEELFLYHTHSILFNLNQRAPFQTAEEFYLHSQKKDICLPKLQYTRSYICSQAHTVSHLCFRLSIYPSVIESLDFSVKKPPSHWRKVKKHITSVGVGKELKGYVNIYDRQITDKLLTEYGGEWSSELILLLL